MNAFEQASQTLPQSEFVEAVDAAMKRAQKAAARENARYGMSLIVEKPCKAPAKAKKAKRATKG